METKTKLAAVIKLTLILLVSFLSEENQCACCVQKNSVSTLRIYVLDVIAPCYLSTECFICLEYYDFESYCFPKNIRNQCITLWCPLEFSLHVLLWRVMK